MGGIGGVSEDQHGPGGAVAEAATEPESPTSGVEAKSGTVEILIDAIDTYYYASSHRSVVRQLTIRNIDVPEDADDIVLSVEVESPLAIAPLHPFKIALPAFLPRDEKVLHSVRMAPNHRALALLDESLRGEIVVTASVGGVDVGSARAPITFLAFNQWMHRPEYFDSLAAFVQPNAAALRPVLTRTGELLRERTGRDATEGYQSLSSDPDRVHHTAHAVFDALGELGLPYSEPPASFEGYGQKVRTPEVVMAERAATCLDSAVLYASCLLALGIEAYLVIVDGHAFTAYRRGHPDEAYDWEALRQILRQSVCDNPNEIALLASAGLLSPVETTFFTAERDKTFADAESQDQSYFTTRVSALQALVNIEYAREHGVPPIPSQQVLAAGGDPAAGEEPVVAAWADQAPAAGPAPGGETERAVMDAIDAPPRVKSWLRSLLDLTFTNPLLRMGGAAGTRGVYRFELPDGLLGPIEDRLMGAGSVDIRLATQAPAALLRDPADVTGLAAELTNSGRLYSPDLVTYEKETARIRTQVAETEPSFPPAQVAKVTADFLGVEYGKELDRQLGALRRKAREIETQTGANTLFLTIGTMEWTETGTSRGRNTNNQGRAPLFLIPVRLSGKAKTGYKITADDTADVIPNYCLLEKLRQTHGLVIDELERPVTDDAGIDVDRMIAKVRETLGKANIRDAVVVEDAYLSVLNFSTFRLWKDMRDHWQTFMESPVVRHLVENPNETYDDPEPAETVDAESLLCPIECDQSQLEAIRMAVEGRSFVLEGPPGTGKSQTIANLLAASIAAGKKVLFVAEKQAALSVVKKRLDKAGLGSFCLDLHDKGSKPDQIRQQIRASLDFAPLDLGTEWTEINARWDVDRSVLDDYRHSLHDASPSGHSAWTARQEQMSIGDGPSFEIPAAFAAQDESMKTAVRNALLNLPRLLGSNPVQPGGAWSFASSTDFAAIDQAALATAVASLATLRDGLASQDANVTAISSGIADPEGFEAVARSLESWLSGQLPTDAELAQIASPAWRASGDATFARLDRFLETQATALRVFVPGIFSVDLSAAIAAGVEAESAGMFGRGKKTKAFNAQVAPYLLAPTELPTSDLLRLLQGVVGVAPELASIHQAIGSIPGLRPAPGWSPLDPTAVGALRDQVLRLGADANVLSSPAAVSTRAALATGWQPTQGTVDLFRSAAGWWTELGRLTGTTTETMARWRNGRSFASAWEASEPVWKSDAPRFLQLQRWTELLASLVPLEAAGLAAISTAILQGEVDPESAYERFRRGFITTALRERLDAGRIDLFDGRSHDRRIADFRDRDAARRTMIRDLIPSQLVEQRPVRGGRRIGKWGSLEQELNRKSRRLSIRHLVTEYSDILPDLAPCFLMSPDSVARFIPPGSITFDMVVFDEASQIKVAESIGALGRARSVIVVGDTRQMPPSQFGGGASPDPDAESDLDEDAVLQDLESILSECVESNLQRLYLECHYRSRHEALISFSNHHFYENRLTTFPSPAGPGATPISWHRLDGRFDRTSKGELLRTNAVEAEAIVADIVRRVHDPATAHESIGVVTLNVQQQALILRLLEETGDERVKALIEDEGEGGLIVRNLESVQGDERDVIILSIAFSPPVVVAADGSESRGRLPLHFGPLINKGGERRLNVAVTRARSEVVVYCSFDPEEMRLKENASLGLQLLRTYLLDARDGHARSGDLVGRAPTPPDLHRSEIAAALRERGLKVRENVGLSDFRIDLTVGRPDDDDWAVAVLLDGPGWAARSTVYDRDALPAGVLQGAMGWRRVERVWFPMWLNARDEVLSDIERAVELALTEPEPSPVTDSERALPPEASPDETELGPLPRPTAPSLRL